MLRRLLLQKNGSINSTRMSISNIVTLEKKLDGNSIQLKHHDGGGQFETIIGLTKQMLYKSLGIAHLTISELDEIALDNEINLNNRPLTYVGNYIELPILTSNSLIYCQSTRVPKNKFDDDDINLFKRQRYIKRCKQAARNP